MFRVYADAQRSAVSYGTAPDQRSVGSFKGPKMALGLRLPSARGRGGNGNVHISAVATTRSDATSHAWPNHVRETVTFGAIISVEPSMRTDRWMEHTGGSGLRNAVPFQCTSPVKITLFTCEQARDVEPGRRFARLSDGPRPRKEWFTWGRSRSSTISTRMRTPRLVWPCLPPTGISWPRIIHRPSSSPGMTWSSPMRMANPDHSAGAEAGNRLAGEAHPFVSTEAVALQPNSSEVLRSPAGVEDRLMSLLYFLPYQKSYLTPNCRTRDTG